MLLDLLTLTEIAARNGHTPAAVCKAVKRLGIQPARKVGNIKLYTQADARTLAVKMKKARAK